MSEDKKEMIRNAALDVYHSRIFDLSTGGFDFLLNMDMESLIKRFNKGEYDVIDSTQFNFLLMVGFSAGELINYILSAKKLLSFKEDFYSDVASKQDGMVYNPKAIYGNACLYSRNKITYEQVDRFFKLAEDFINSNRAYALLKFYLKYGSLVDQIRVRQRLFARLKNNPAGTERLHNILNKYDPEVGIIKIVEDGKVSIEVGTRHDMEISNLIGKPFIADCDIPGYEHPRNYYFYDGHKVTKEFYEGGTTPNHAKAIEAEKKYRRRLSQSTINEDGFILTSDSAIIISSLELTKLGIDPKRVGWTPLKLTVQPEDLFKVCEKHLDTRYLSFKTKAQLKKKIILSKRHR